MASPAARRLRANPTEAERRLGDRLRRRQLEGLRFRRQASIGPYIVDFVCYSEKLVIEVDGGQHSVQVDHDTARTRWLENRGFRVLRFWNNDVLANGEGVLKAIRQALPDTPPSLTLPHEGGGDRKSTRRRETLPDA